jgi:membrane-bound lytic murein transglycosylase D
VPAGTAAKFQTAVAAIPVDKRVSWRYHKVQGGETLASIARTYHTTPTAIAEANDLSDSSKSGSSVSSNAGSKAGLKVVSNRGSSGSSYGGSYNEALAPESRLIIPIAPSKQTDTSTYAHSTTRYQVRKGDTVESVAENFGVSAKMVRGWNHLKGSSLAGRKVLYVHLPVAPGARETQVASRRSSRKSCRDGACPVSGANRPQHPAGTQTASSSAAAHAAVKHHKVKQGETLYSIANSYNTTVSALKHDNRNLAALRPGMILIVRDGH